MNENPTVLCVLGMHRSGTSAIAKGIESWSVSLGDQLIGAGPDNPRGYWEDHEVVAINQILLERCNLRWNEARLLSREEVLAAADAGLVQRATTLFQDRCESWGLWGFKDPRTLRTLPFWLEVADTAGIELRFLWALRHPAEVVASLAARNAMDPIRSQFMWAAHWLPFLSLLQGRKNAVLRFSELFQDPATALHSIALCLGYEIREELLPSYQKEFLQASLHHHHCPDDTDLLAPIARLYQALNAIHLTPSAAFWEQWQSLYSDFSVWGPVCALLDQETDWRRRRRGRLWKLTHGKIH
ncbi:sulfotransferase family protein [Acidithiobacillus sp. IBUN Pt1247-S3]|uniref:sulfotransferase family protein n=1 Tax=Acidithiobacillus sp. IBUN Pt1247-S3 TaxID=3166642 RepID=UPI0034E407BA